MAPIVRLSPRARKSLSLAVVGACALSVIDQLFSDDGLSTEFGDDGSIVVRSSSGGGGGGPFGFLWGGERGGSSANQHHHLLRRQLASEEWNIWDELDPLWSDERERPGEMEYGKNDVVGDEDADGVEEDDEDGRDAEDDEEEGGEGDEISVESAREWARTNMHRVTEAPGPEDDFLFWHVPKSGGSTVKTLYRCMGKTINIASQLPQIEQDVEMGLIASGQIDLTFSSLPDIAVDRMYDDGEHRARGLAMFRHPVDRLVSKFYYLQVATWEKTYRPEWKDMDILEWAKHPKYNLDNDHTVKKLAGKKQRDSATEEDLTAAMATLESSFVVGLITKMEESIRRFNLVMGIDDEGDDRNKRCMDRYFGEEGKKTNSNKHPKVTPQDEVWQVLAEKNALDIRFYEYAERLFAEQEEIVNSYPPPLRGVGGGSEVASS